MPDVTPADTAELERFLEAHPDTEYIDAIFVDICGIIRGKRYPRPDLEKLFSSGLQIPITVYLLDVTGDSDDPGGKGFTDGDPDGTAIPIAGSLVPVPWSADHAGQVLMTVRNQDGTPNQFDPRNVATRVIDRLAADGLHAVVAFELEFYLFDRELDADGVPQVAKSRVTGERESTTQVYGIWELDAFPEFFRDVREATEAQGIPASVATKEFAPGQYEINLRHVDDPLAAADHCALLRHVVKNVAARHSYRASFISKPYAEQVGSGMHLHMSIVDDDGQNIFASEDELGSPELGHAIAGMQAGMAEAMGIYAPHVNAFRRFGLNMFTPLNTSWGSNNRSLTFRIPGGSGDSRRVEHRIAGADANPYLVLAAALAGMHHGLSNKLDPGPTTDGNAGEYVDPAIPFNMRDALDCMKDAPILDEYLGARYVEIYRELKQGELNLYNSHITPVEYSWYL